MAVHPVRGVDVGMAVETLRRLSSEVGAFRGPPVGRTDYDAVTLRQREYLTWVENAERQVAQIFGVAEALALLHTAAYWRIQSMDRDGPRPLGLIAEEARRQGERLGGLAHELRERQEAFGGQGPFFVADTNVFLHYRTVLEPERWCQEALEPAARVVVPLRVVQQLDEKKHDDTLRIRKRARKTLARFREIAGQSLVGPLHGDADLRVVVADGVFDADSDQEILNVASVVATYSSSTVTVLTGDLSMQLRARAAGLDARAMPESLELPRDAPDANDEAAATSAS